MPFTINHHPCSSADAGFLRSQELRRAWVLTRCCQSLRRETDAPVLGGLYLRVGEARHAVGAHALCYLQALSEERLLLRPAQLKVRARGRLQALTGIQSPGNLRRADVDLAWAEGPGAGRVRPARLSL